ncbi:hypothetical protein ACKWTF_006852 [Chironomus riparius]
MPVESQLFALYVADSFVLISPFILTTFFPCLSTVLAQRDYFKDPAFVNYLNYLQYWKKPEYAKFIKYPMCLYFLDLLQSEEFRRKIVSAQCCKFIDDQSILLWQHYSRRRTRTLADKGKFKQ